MLATIRPPWIRQTSNNSSSAKDSWMDSALVGVIVGGLIGLSTQILTASVGRRQLWEEARRQVYVTYLERVSLSRRRLQKQVENKLAGLPTYDAEAKERREAGEVTIAG